VELLFGCFPLSTSLRILCIAFLEVPPLALVAISFEEAQFTEPLQLSLFPPLRFTLATNLNPLGLDCLVLPTTLGFTLTLRTGFVVPSCTSLTLSACVVRDIAQQGNGPLSLAVFEEFVHRVDRTGHKDYRQEDSQRAFEASSERIAGSDVVPDPASSLHAHWLGSRSGRK